MLRKIFFLVGLLLGLLGVSPGHAGDATATERNPISVSVYVGTPLSIAGSTGTGMDFSSRDKGPGSGYEIGAGIHYVLWKEDDWSVGVAGQFTWQYLRTAVSGGGGRTEGSITTYTPAVGGFVRYDFTQEWSGCVTLTAGPTYVDFHDQGSNSSGWAVTPRATLDVTYCESDWVVCPGVYVAGFGTLPLNAKGEKGRSDLSGGNMYGGTIGLMLKF